MPPDVRKVSDFPGSFASFSRLRPNFSGHRPEKEKERFSEGHRPSAHQAAQPRRTVFYRNIREKSQSPTIKQMV